MKVLSLLLRNLISGSEDGDRAGLNESPELIAQESVRPLMPVAVESNASMKVLSLLLRNYPDGNPHSRSPLASMKVLSLLLRNRRWVG